MRWRWLFVTVAAACSGGAEEMPPPADAPAADAATCSLPPGQSYVVTSIHLLPSDMGFDLDGDGTVDNHLGELPPDYLQGFNDGTDTGVNEGQLLLAMHLTNWSDPLTPDDDDIVFHAYHVWDADMPEDPSNNFSGTGQFLVPLNQFDLTCQTPDHTADQTTLEKGILTAVASSLAFNLSSTGTLTAEDGTMVVTFAPDFSSADGLFGARVSLCSLSALPYPGQLSNGTVLDVFVNDPNLASLDADIDVDGDGIERVEGDGVTVLRCYDGDGTVIDGSACPCHPAIADAYSFSLRFLFVPATIVGVI